MMCTGSSASSGSVHLRGKIKKGTTRTMVPGSTCSLQAMKMNDSDESMLKVATFMDGGTSYVSHDNEVALFKTSPQLHHTLRPLPMSLESSHVCLAMIAINTISPGA